MLASPPIVRKTSTQELTEANLKNPDIQNANSVESIIHNISLIRSSMLPLRLIDVDDPSTPFVVRNELCARTENEILQQCYSPTRFNLAEVTARIAQLTRFAILSHTWEPNELTYDKVRNAADSSRYEQSTKIKGLFSEARSYGCRYVWMDAVCIDKTSSTELDESIRSMYTWYKTASVCIVYLSKYDCSTQIPKRDPWFLRGWTLQEVLAARRVIFFDREWRRVFYSNGGNDFDLTRTLEPVHHDYHSLRHKIVYTPNTTTYMLRPSPRNTGSESTFDRPPSPLEWIKERTGISLEDLNSYEPSPKHARKIFSYMQYRSTTVPEDIAYCLTGLLGITLPIAYGEGADRALYRLQVACAEASDERNIFLWNPENNLPSRFNSMLPGHPFTALPSPFHDHKFISLDTVDLFRAPQMFSLPYRFWRRVDRSQYQFDPTFAFTNGGLRIALILHTVVKYTCGEIYCKVAPGRRIGVSPETNFNHPSKMKLAILGTYPDGLGAMLAFPIILERLGPSRFSKYRRVACTVDLSTLPSTKKLLSRLPQIVYIS